MCNNIGNLQANITKYDEKTKNNYKILLALKL